MKVKFFGNIFLLVSLVGAADLQAKVIEDMLGRSVQVPEDIQRIASPYRVSTDMIFALGKQEKLIATSTRNPNRVFRELCPKYKRLKVANRDSSLEAFLNLRPDVVFMRPGSLVDKLEQLDISVFCLKVETPHTMIDGLIMISRVLGVQDKAQKMADYFQRKLDYIKKQTQ